MKKILAVIKQVTSVEPIIGEDTLQMCHMGEDSCPALKESGIKPGDLVLLIREGAIPPKWGMFGDAAGVKIPEDVIAPLEFLEQIENPDVKYHKEQQLIQHVYTTSSGKKAESLGPVAEGYDLTKVLCLTSED